MGVREKLRELRLLHGWTQLQLANKAKVPQPTVWRLENGKINNPKIGVLSKLATALGVTVDELVEERQQELPLFEQLFPADKVGQAVFRGYERLSRRDRDALLHFVRALEAADDEADEGEPD